MNLAKEKLDIAVTLFSNLDRNGVVDSRKSQLISTALASSEKARRGNGRTTRRAGLIPHAKGKLDEILQRAHNLMQNVSKRVKSSDKKHSTEHKTYSL